MAFFMFPVLMALILTGFPIAFSLIGVAFGFGLWEFGPGFIYQFSQKLSDLATNFVIAAIPLFVFMGAVLERSGMADDMIIVVNRWLSRLPGGLGISAIILCVIFAASSGVSGATEAIVGMLAIPAMQRCKYPNDLIAGVICSGGSLGTIIPPSVFVLILAPAAELPIIEMFKATLIPGLMLAAGYALYVALRCAFRHPEIKIALKEKAKLYANGSTEIVSPLFDVLKAFLPPITLIVIVLGSIFNGWATTTEAAALGAIGAMLIAATRLRLGRDMLLEAASKTVQVTCMILTIILGGSLFSTVFVVAGGLDAAQSFFDTLNAEPYQVLLAILVITFLLGFMLDQISMILILIPLTIPIIRDIGYDPIWYSVVFMMTLQTSYLTPPMAPAIFFLKGINPPGITLTQMYRGVIPFIVVQIIIISIVIIFPNIIYF